MMVKNYLYKYFYLLGDNRSRFPTLLLLFVISSILDMLGIGLIAPFIQLATQPDSVEKYQFLKSAQSYFSSYDRFIVAVGLTIALVFYFKSIIGYYVQKAIMSFSFNNKANLINRLMNTYQRLDYSFHVKRNSASLIQRLLENTNIYTEMTLISSLRLLSEAIVILCIFILLAYSNMLVTFSTAILLLAIILIYDKFVKKHFYKAGEELVQSSEDILKWFNQAIYGFKEIRVLGAERFFYDKVQTSGKTFASAASFAQALQSLPRYLAESALLTVVIGMVILTIETGNSLTALIPVLGMFAVASFRLIPSINKAATSFTNIRYSRKAMTDLYDDLSLINNSVAQEPDIRKENSQLMDVINFNVLSLEHVCFHYPENSKNILNDISVSLKQGECLGFVGKSGSGKTTLIDLLLGLYQPTKGAILLDDINIVAISDQWRKMTAYIPQNFFLLDDTIKSNITLCPDNEPIDETKFNEAIKAASLDEVIASLEKGRETTIGEHGVMLSGGQRQRIALARAFYHDREIIIMDEATSSLDSETESQIVETIANMKGKKTLIVIAHRKSTLSHCDRIFELGSGQLQQIS